MIMTENIASSKQGFEGHQAHGTSELDVSFFRA